MLTFDGDAYFLVAVVVFSTLQDAMNGVPMMVALSNTAFFFHFNRANAIDANCDGTTKCLVVPRHAIVSATRWGRLDCVEQGIRCLFTEWGTPVVTASEFFTVVRSKKRLVVKKYQTLGDKGMEVEAPVGYWQFLVPGSKDEQDAFLNGLKMGS